MRAPKTKEGGKVQAVPPALLLANKWTPDIDPNGWWMSEKLDGIRAYWTGKELISRLGNKLYAPEWFTKDLGEDPLDGELWLGRKKFQETMSIVRSQGLDEEWRPIKYLIFDMPGLTIAEFEERRKFMAHAKLPDHCVIVEQMPCNGVDHLKATLKALEEKGAEGVMLRKPHSRYEGRRSPTLLKVKSFYDDEATIIGYEPGKGRHKGRLGGYVCVLANGVRFSVGSGLTDKERNSPLKINTKITFRYCELTDTGVPRFPTYVGECLDK
jgi:DNA ligase-1